MATKEGDLPDLLKKNAVNIDVIRIMRAAAGTDIVNTMERAALPDGFKDWYCACDKGHCERAASCARYAQYLLDNASGLGQMYAVNMYTDGRPPFIHARHPKFAKAGGYTNGCDAYIDTLMITSNRRGNPV